MTELLKRTQTQEVVGFFKRKLRRLKNLWEDTGHITIETTRFGSTFGGPVIGEHGKKPKDTQNLS